MATVPAVTAAHWQALASRRILFGHQSVGRNILDGVGALAAQAGVSLPVADSRGPDLGPGISHFAVGRNGDPLGKVRDFAAAVDSAATADIALFKLCYIDLSEDGDPRQAAAAYADTLDALRKRHRQTAFVAMTVPLTTVQGGPKALVKRMLGRVPDGYVENARRQLFNETLRARFSRDGRLFDLAAIEAAARPIHHDGQVIPCLDPALTHDGGHLNDAGARLVASSFLVFLADLDLAPGDR